jgi:hypothetical protein
MRLRAILTLLTIVSLSLFCAERPREERLAQDPFLRWMDGIAQEQLQKRRTPSLPFALWLQRKHESNWSGRRCWRFWVACPTSEGR